MRRQFEGIYRFLLNKWWFDELYDFLFVRPSHFVARLAAAVDRRWIDGLIDGSARFTRGFAVVWDRLADHLVVDGSVNAFRRRRVRLGRLAPRRANGPVAAVRHVHRGRGAGDFRDHQFLSRILLGSLSGVTT